MGQVNDFCCCALPIKMIRRTSDMYKTWFCARCEKAVDPKSKMLERNVDKVSLVNPTRNEKILMEKYNEIVELMRANGDMQ